MMKNLFSLKKSAKPVDYSTGEGTVVSGVVYKSVNGAEIKIGKNCLIEGTITTYTASSKINIGNNVFVGKGTLIGSAENISIGDNVLISFDCLIQDSDTHSLDAKDRENDLVSWRKGEKDWSKIIMKSITIESNAWIGAKSIILKGVRIGKNAIVGAGSVVTKNVEDDTVVGGNPATLIKRLK